jgi:Tfp pilus assembly protein PilX
VMEVDAVKPRRGFALAAALLSIMLIAALLTSVFFAAMEETRISGVSGSKQLALSAAESAIEMTIADWPGTNTDPIGVAGTRTSRIDAFGTPADVSVTRLDSTLYWIVAKAPAVSSESSAMRRIGVVVRVEYGLDHSIRIDRIPERWWSELF